MTSAEYVTRTEFRDLANRVDWLDEHGTRGVGALQVQMSELIRDVTKLEAAQAQHVDQHQREARDRAAGRRWLVAGVLIPTATVLISAVGIIAVILGH